jgi:hypothetical protein
MLPDEIALLAHDAMRQHRDVPSCFVWYSWQLPYNGVPSAMTDYMRLATGRNPLLEVTRFSVAWVYFCGCSYACLQANH